MERRETIIIPGARGRILLMFAGCLATTAFAIFFFLDPEAAPKSPSWVWPWIAGLFGAFSAVHLGLLYKPPQLSVGPEGLAQRMLWRVDRWTWSEVGDFRTISQNGVTMVQFADRRRGSSTPVVLSPIWALKPELLLRLLVESQRRWSASPLADNAPTS